MFRCVVQSLVELSKAGSEERSLLESLSNRAGAKGARKKEPQPVLSGDGGRASGGRLMARRKKPTALIPSGAAAYGGLVTGIADLLDQARRGAARAINSILTATYWEIGRRIVEFEQGGKARAEYGEELLSRLTQDLSARHGRGFSRQGLQKMRAFYLGWEICPTPSGKFEGSCPKARRNSRMSIEEKCPTVSSESCQFGRYRLPNC